MSVKFFGQFLIEQGEIDAGELREALTCMQKHNKSLDELAIQAGLLSRAHADELNAAQRVVDRSFGELAVERGLLSRAALERLLASQAEQRLPLGEALVRIGALEATRLGALLDRFKIDQSPYASGNLSLPGALAGVRVAAIVLDLLPRVCMRVARLHVKLAPARPQRGDTPAHRAVIRAVSGAHAVELGIAADDELARSLAAGVSGLGRSATPVSLLADALGEFLNVLMGSAVAALEREGARAQLDTVRHGALPAGGYAFDLVATEGRGALVADSALG
jgi:hypothetical protein